MHLVRAAVLTSLLTGCAIEVDPTVGRHFTIEHGTARFQDAMQAARKHCTGMGMDARHVGTDQGGLLLSRFECVQR